MHYAQQNVENKVVLNDAMHYLVGMQDPVYIHMLRQEWARRMERNARYSLRSFAQALKIEASSLSRILAGNRVPSLKIANLLVSGLHLSPEDSQQFWRSLAERKAAQGLKRMSPLLRNRLTAPAVLGGARWSEQARELSSDLFRAISDWYHFALLELTFLPGFRMEPRWVARRLGISPGEAKLALERLVALDLLKSDGGRWYKRDSHIASADKQLTTSAHRGRQKQILLKSLDALESDPIEQRVHQGMTMSIDSDLLPEARLRIQNFHRELCLFLESGTKLDGVFEVQTSLFRLDRKVEKNEY